MATASPFAQNGMMNDPLEMVDFPENGMRGGVKYLANFRKHSWMPKLAPNSRPLDVLYGAGDSTVHRAFDEFQRAQGGLR